jgi:hypothetical protein
MKKVLLILGLVISVNMMFAQPTATLKIGTQYDPIAGTVLVPVTLEAINNPVIGSNLISSWGWYIGYNAAVLNAGPVNGPATLLNYNPQFPSSNYLTNIIPDNPTPGWNTIAVIYSAAVSGTGNPGSKFFDIQFTYVGLPAQTDIIWTSTAAKGDFATKFATNMADDEGNEFVLTLVNGYCGPTPSLGKVWTGLGGDLNWFNPGNWAPPGVPASEDVTINASKAPMVVISGGPATCGALTVALGAGINVVPTGSLTTNGLYTNNGQLIISSDNTGKSGSYINIGGLAGAGTFEFDRNVWKFGDPPPFGDWHYISAPMAAGFENWDFLDYFGLTWNAGAGLWNNMGGGAPNCIPAPQVTINGMSSWAINWDPTYTTQGCPGGTGNTIEMVGPFLGIQTGPFNAPAVTGGPGGGWNMYGNPYASSLAVAGLNYAGFVPGVAMFSPVTDNYVYSTPGNGWAAGNIAPTQGFFVQAIGAPAFAVGNVDRIHDLNVVWKEDVSNLLTLEATGNDRSDVLYVRIDMEGALPGFDNVGDFNKLFAEGMPQIYTIADGQKLAVNALPATPSVPMEFTAGTSGTYTIEAIETSEFANVVLEDLANGMETDLLAGSYTFEYSEGAVHNFVIHFTPLGTPELNANNINIWAADHNIYVQAPATTGDIVVYNLMGQEVVKTDIEAGLNVIPMTDVNTYYIVKVIGSDVTETGKVFIK